MENDKIYEDGFTDFAELLEEFGKKTGTENVLKVLEIGAKEFVSDVRALPKPRSTVRAPGYTHLLDTVTYQKSKNEVVTGWGKYYGPMVENGTIRADGTPHMRTTWERNRENYYKKMQNALYR